jgi:outer membrane lipoprotein SlyB
MLKQRNLVALAGVVIALTGCRGVEELTGRDPIVDMKGVNVAQYETDLAECQQYADQVQTGRQVATGAATGAVVGGAVGAIIGNGRTAARTAGVGAVSGGLQGAGGGLSDRRRVIRNCLENRGYSVLN